MTRTPAAAQSTEPTAAEAVSAEPPSTIERPVMRQRWTDLAYFHWPYPPEVVQALLPDGLTVDTHDGVAWVGLVPFVMRDVRVGPLPRLPYLSTFVEINVRTYVVDRFGRRAVWFWSLDVPRSAIVLVARTCFSLPYCWSASARHELDGDRHRFTMRRTWPRGDGAPPFADMAFRVGAPLDDASTTELHHFLTARWALNTRRGGSLRRGRVHHERWPLHEVHDVELRQTVVEAAGLPTPIGAPHALWSPGVAVAVGWLER